VVELTLAHRHTDDIHISFEPTDGVLLLADDVAGGGGDDASIPDRALHIVGGCAATAEQTMYVQRDGKRASASLANIYGRKEKQRCGLLVRPVLTEVNLVRV
jgi:hypothetical protein